jgi:hypothetical protein
MLVVGTTVWIGYDAQALGMRKGRLGGGPVDMGTRSWVTCCLLLWAIAFPCYFVARAKYVALRDAPMPPVHAAPVQAMSVPVTPVKATPSLAPRQLSPDGNWWWDGTQWTPAQQAVAPPQLSADGNWWWDGAQWIAAAGAVSRV